MSLMTCSKCGKEYSDRAKNCPNCGEIDIKKQKEKTVSFSPKKILVLSCIMFVLALFFFVYGITKFTWKEFGIHKSSYEIAKESYIKNMYVDAEFAEWEKENMDSHKSKMIESAVTAVLSFASSCTLFFTGATFLKEQRAKPTTDS